MHSLLTEFLAEFIGTFILMSIGLSGAATKTLGDHNTILIPAAAYGAGALIGSFFAGPISGGHLNPAVSLAHAVIGKCRWRSLPVFVFAQYLGSLFASATIYGLYLDSIMVADSNLTLETASIFITSPAKHITLIPAIGDQILSTGLLVFSALMISNQSCFRFGVPSQILSNSLLVFTFILAFNFNAGAILNPARDLAPRIFLSIVGYKTLPFQALSGNFWWAAGILAPHIGAIIGALAYEFFQKIREEYYKKNSHSVCNENVAKIQTIIKEFDSSNSVIFQ